jgi:hypothetical protein
MRGTNTRTQAQRGQLIRLKQRVRRESRCGRTATGSGPRFEAGAAWGVRVGAGCGGGVERELERLRRERRLARSLSLAQLVEVLCRSR